MQRARLTLASPVQARLALVSPVERNAANSPVRTRVHARGRREEERRQAKRARGILASSLPYTFFSYFGVTKCVPRPAP